MSFDLEKILEEAKERLSAAVTPEDTEDIRVSMLGKNGKVTSILRSMGSLPPAEKKEIGQAANALKKQIEGMLNDKVEEVKKAALGAKLKAEKLDVTEPGKAPALGSEHPITITINELVKVFNQMGFTVVEGPEVETVWYNFDALNAPVNHPSRDMSDTFYFSEDQLLRTHTSPDEVRTMQTVKPPFKVVIPGRCFRYDTPDATHSPMFHQMEGLVIGEGINMGDLKGALDRFAKLMFGEKVKTRLRPSHFPFTEPSAEMDVTCFKCGGKGCNVCKGTGWIEILGCGMTHPHVIKAAGLDPEKYTGFAFGMGVERVAMLKYGVDDIRLFYENDMRFISQFK